MNSNLSPPQMDQQLSSPPFDSPSSNPGFPIAAIIAVGFFATALVLTIYYIMVIKFWLNNRQRQNSNMPPIFFSYDVEAQGVDPKVINLIPIVKFTKGENGEYKMKNWLSHECAVCLAEFQEKDSLKVLPGCSHAFHVDCIDTWLQFNENCPMCRSIVTSSSLIGIQHDQISGQLETEIEGGEKGEDDVRDRDGKAVMRSFSMDWFREKGNKRGEASSSGTNQVATGETSGRFMRLVHSFRLGRSSRSTVLPIQNDP